MYIIIVGCGRTGGRLANILSTENHNVVAIDNDSSSFKVLDPSFNGITIEGNGIDEQVLEEAGIKEADALLAMTDDDNTNIMVSQVAEEFFNVDRVITKINNQEREDLYKNLGLETINTTEMGAFETRNALLKRKFQRLIIDEKENMDILVFEVEEEFIGRNPFDLETEVISILSIIRDKNVIQAKEIEKLEQGDKVVLVKMDIEYEELLNKEGGLF